MNYLILKIFLRLIIYGLIIYVVLSLYFMYVYIHPTRFVSKIAPKDLGLEYEDITLKTKDGLKLAGWFIPHLSTVRDASVQKGAGFIPQKKSRKAVIVCHGYPADKGDVLELAAFLAPHYNLLFFDFRAMGKSEGKFSTGGWMEREDFLAAIRFLKERGFSDIGAFGFSMGGAVILMSESPDIKAIVSDSSYVSLDSVLNLIFKNFGFLRYPFVSIIKLWARLFFKADLERASPLKYISKIKAPIFLIHSQKDSQIPLGHAQLLHKESPQSLLWIIPGADHGEGFGLRQREYQEKVLKFFQEHL